MNWLGQAPLHKPIGNVATGWEYPIVIKEVQGTRRYYYAANDSQAHVDGTPMH